MKLLFFKRDVSKQFIRFALVGLESTILYYLIFIVLFNFLDFYYLLSATIAFFSGIVFGFTFNKLYTFGSKERNTIAFPIYFFVYLFSLSFTLLSLRFLVEYINIYPTISMAMLIPITAFINFFGTKILAFKNKKW